MQGGTREQDDAKWILRANGLWLLLGATGGRGAVPARGRDAFLPPDAAAVLLLLGRSNLVFWPIFAAVGAPAVGYVTTALHLLFVAPQLAAAVAGRDDRRSTPDDLAIAGARP